jgi:RNA polymerase sigma-70 factor (ECF subfamily)
MKVKDYDNLTDEELVKKITEEGLSDLYSLIYKRYFPRVLEKSNSLLKNRELAKIFAQDILARVFEKLTGFKGNSSFSSWVYTITYNHCIDYLRANKKLHYPEWNSENQLPEIIDVIEEDLTDLHYAQLQDLLNRLHTEEKALLLMKYQDDLSLKEIATSMRLTESAVKMRLMRAKARLTFLFKTIYGDYSGE